MRFNMKNSAFMALCATLLGSCNTDDPTSGITQTLDCDYFKEARVLVNDPEASIDYLITCNMSVEADITVMPGVTIAFATDAGIVVQGAGSFKAEGTAAEPITFTGEDGVKGSWRGVIVYSNDPKNVFDHCVVEHAGGIAHNSNGDRGAFIVWAEARLGLTNSTVRLSASHGLNATYGNSLVELGGNTFTGNDGAPLYVRYNYVNVPSANDSYTGNEISRILLAWSSTPIESNTTWKKVDVDYQVEASVTITVKEGGLLTVEPGVNAYFGAGSQLKIIDEAALSAIGTTSQPIGFYGSVEVNGAWAGIEIRHTSNVQNVLDNVTVAYAGGGGLEGAIYMWANPKLTVSNSEISNSGSCAFFSGASGSGVNPNLTVQNMTFVNNAGADYCD